MTNEEILEKLNFLSNNECNDFQGTGGLSYSNTADKDAEEWYRTLNDLINEFKNRVEYED